MPKPAPYANTDYAETDSILVFKRAVDGKRIKLDVKERDKVPNIDGFLEIVDDDGVPIGKLDVQVRTIPSGSKYRCPVSLVEYSRITTLPVLLIAVDREKQIVYWKHVNDSMPEFKGKENQQTFTLSFDSNSNVVGKSGRYISDWLEVARNYQKKIIGDLQGTQEEQIARSQYPLELLPTPKDIERVRSILKAASSGLLTWPKTIDGNRWLDRPLLSDILNTLRSSNTSTILLLGDPGSGKSALLSKLAEEFLVSDVTLLAFKADQLSVEVNSVDTLGNFLGVKDCASQIQSLALVGPVVILIDQLDALADLVDLKSDRLNAVIQFISELAGRNNIHIVSSCRRFEAAHDPRLRNLQPQAEMLILDLPLWDEIQPIFDELGIATKGWPETMRQVLRAPQHLLVFLQIIPENALEPQIFQSYLAMLHRYWEKQFESLDSLDEDLLLELAFKMSECEELWLPVAQFNRETINRLVAAGFLIKDDDNGKVGFRHQTMFDYGRARAFIRTEESLVNHVLQRQDGLFVRPLLWTILPYLREANPSVYRRELGGLWKRELRFHLRVLLIEFLGLIEEPTEFELSLMLDYLTNPDYQTIVLSSMAKSKGWFERVKQYLLVLMNLGKEVAGLVYFLQSALLYASDEVFTMIEKAWLVDSIKDPLSLAVLRSLSDWSPSATEITETILHRTEFAPIAVCQMASSAEKLGPQYAVRLIRAAVQNQIHSAQRKLKEQIAVIESSEFSDEERKKQRTQLRWFNPVKDLLDSNDWDCVYDLVSSCSEPFVDMIFPIITHALDSIADEDDHVAIRYRDDNSGSNLRYFDGDNEVPFDDGSLIGALRLAVVSLAKKNAEHFQSVLEKYETSSLLYVHSSLADGLLQLDSRFASVALNYLLADERRFFIGYNSDEQVLSNRLISHITPHLSGKELLLLEEKIITLTYYRLDDLDDESSAIREARLKRGQRNLLRALHAFPRELLSCEGRALLDHEAQSMQPSNDSGMRTILTVTEESDSDKELVAHQSSDNSIDVKLADIALSVVNDPEDSVGVLLSVESTQNAKLVGKALENLAHSEIEDSRLFDLIEHLNEKRIEGSAYRASVSKALLSRIQENKPLPEQMISLLENFLEEVSVTTYEDRQGRRQQDSSMQEGKRDRLDSVLWGRGVEPVPVQDSYSILYCLTLGLLQHEPRQPERWLEILNRHLSRFDSVEVWCSLSVTYLKFLSLCKAESAELFLGNLFDYYPMLFDDYHAAKLLAQTMVWTSEEFSERWISRIADSTWKRAGQAFGELLCLQQLWFQNRSWPRSKIDELIKRSQDDVYILAGIAFVAAKLWHHIQYRARATEIIDKLLSLRIKTVTEAVAIYISNGQNFSVDPYSERILSRLLESIEFLDGHLLFQILESIVELTPWRPNFVYDFCMSVINSVGTSLGDIRTSECMLSGPLLDVAIRLQRMDEHHRRNGMDIFDALLRCRAYEAVGLLHTIDGRPKAENRVKMPRRRERKNKNR